MGPTVSPSFGVSGKTFIFPSSPGGFGPADDGSDVELDGVGDALELYDGESRSVCRTEGEADADEDDNGDGDVCVDVGVGVGGGGGGGLIEVGAGDAADGKGVTDDDGDDDTCGGVGIVGSVDGAFGDEGVGVLDGVETVDDADGDFCENDSVNVRVGDCATEVVAVDDGSEDVSCKDEDATVEVTGKLDSAGGALVVDDGNGELCDAVAAVVVGDDGFTLREDEGVARVDGDEGSDVCGDSGAVDDTDDDDDGDDGDDEAKLESRKEGDVAGKTGEVDVDCHGRCEEPAGDGREYDEGDGEGNGGETGDEEVGVGDGDCDDWCDFVGSTPGSSEYGCE
ncbi:hypothetical protein THASP1DRAFT_33454 [Thamnocephalis sphaerospora]|uniref:Uncharacterized protein n=1 Tax=Thamnocephalis sphaerospora TaxID=78915 RepID=A0A4P9XGJ9_9FUNG|nr:hypothetical protein THASP1DRAFT_33454 [Thamnocephalis sphaerospora]|eukprot:RKP04742.1 hypothetical protein THASP1DRAFT_33454 [Thamnocephalis sphaerospora]